MRRPLLQTSSPLKTKKPENSHYDWYSEWGHFTTQLVGLIEKFGFSFSAEVAEHRCNGELSFDLH